MNHRPCQTIQISSRVLAHGELVEVCGNGDALIRDGNKLYRGRPVAMSPTMPMLRSLESAPAELA